MTELYGYKLGRRPAVTPIGYKDMSFFMEQEPPDPPLVPYDLTKGLNGFQMQGNGPDSTLTVNGGKPVGDCGIVMSINLVYVGCAIQKFAFKQPSSNVTVNWYLQYCGGDTGIVNSTFFAFWLKNHLPWANPLRAVAGVNSNDFDELMAYNYLCGGVMLGVALTQGNLDQTNAGEPWDTTGDPTVVGGHDVLLLPRMFESDLTGVATWGMVQQVTSRWVVAQSDEADVAIRQSEDPAGIDHVDYEKLDVYMAALAGNAV